MFYEKEEDPLPCARLVSISRPSYWLYFAVCSVLFVISLFDPPHRLSNWLIPSLIAAGIFIALLLEVLSQKTDNRTAALLVNANYILETGSAIAFMFLLFGH